ncbi:conserved hypothetical protein, partial [Leishmania braziliensis MHOM/BR/75/M2904]
MVAHKTRAPALQRVGTPEEPRVGLVATTHRVRLDGDAWARVLEACPDLLKQEFTSDVCDATSLPPTSMRRLVLAAGSLVADFELAHGGLARTELNEQIARSPFTRTWALYQRVAAPEETLGPRAAPPAALQDSESFASLDVEEPPAVLRREGTPEVATMVAHEARAPALQRVGTPEEPRVGLVATTHRVRLDGDAWARVLEACPDLLKQEFTSDVCDATSLPPTSMRRLVLAAGSLVADFELAHGGLARTELNEQIARSPFTRTWALYQRVAAPEETLGPRAAPPAALQDSESFASLDVEEPPAVLRREGTPEVATMVAHEARAPALQRVGTPEEPRVGLVATTHRVRLDGDAWARVLEACPDLLKQEFTSDVCDATSLPPTSMRRLVLAAGSLVADFELAHGGLARTELNEQIARSPFTRTWALYQRVAAPEETLGPRAAPPATLQDSESFASLDVEEPPAVLRREGTPEVATMVAHEARAPALQRVGTPEEPRVGLVATKHRVRLDGDAWARVLEACPDLLKQEFTSDVCDATSLPPTSMRRLVLAAGSLVADFELAHGGLARTELDEQIARSPFIRTWALYQRVAAPEETLGPRAAPPATLQDSESFASLDVEEPPAVLRREGTPEVATMVAHEARAPALQRVGTPEEPRVGLVATTHRVRLDGDAWARVLEACPDLLKQEFTSDVCDATSLPPTSMRRLVLAAGSLVADFELAHGGLARTELNEQIARSPFTRTWALYQRVAAPEETLAPRAAPLEEAPMVVVSDVPAEHELSQRTAEPVGFSRDDLASAGPAALQRVGTPEEPRVGLVATTHRVRLDGDAWARVLEACPDLLKQEFTSDVCDATSLPPTSMRRLVLAAGSLVADFELAHGGLARTELDEQIARSPFTRTWALYQRVAAPEETLGPRAATLEEAPMVVVSDVPAEHELSQRTAEPVGFSRDDLASAGPAALQRVGTPEEPRVGLVATTHRVRLDGDAWARVLEACPDLLKQEFTSDVCDATSLPPTSMRRLVLAAGSLVADFELAHGGLARTELDEQIARSPFIRTWALYQRVAAPEETLAPRAATLEEAPMVVVSDVPAEHELSQRTAEPVGFSRDDLASAGPAALQRVGTPEEPRVGLVATTHRVRLDGDAWARVLEACPDLLKQEFTSDVCDATSLPPTSMRRLVLAAGSLVADFELAHGGLARTELDEQIARSPFTRTWALYQRVAAPEETLGPRAATLEEAPMVVVSDVPAEHELSQRTAEPVGFSRDDLASAGPAALQRVGTPEEPRVGLVATTHRVRLDGDAWARVLEACPDLLKQEFTSDVCDATSLPPTSMRRLVLAAGSLVADFELAHGGLAGTELDEQIARSPFTRTWALYQRVAAPEETLGPSAATLEEAPMVVVSDVPAEHELSQRTAEPVGFSRDDLASAGPAALQRVGTPEEPRVGLVATTHRVRLDGDAWARVLEACPDLLKREFTSDVCDATSLPPTSMRRLVLAAGSLVADFELAHGGLARTELDEQIARSPFTRTWALYQRVAAPEETLAPRAATLEEAPMVVVSDVPAEHELSQRTAEPVGFSRDDLASAGPAALQRVGTPEEPRVGLVATTHRVRLDGDAWARVLEACPDLLKQEFTSDVCDATSLPPTSMRRLVLAAGSLVVDFELAHGGLAGTELDEQIARSPFTRTWALYQRVAAPEETLAPRAAPPAALQDSESFASLDVEEPPAVLRREGTPEVATMVAHEARAPALQRVGTPEEPRVGLVATTHRVRLDGDAWARVLEACPDLLKREFTSDVCDATSLPPTSMRRLVLAAGSLVADFELAHGGLARTELDEQIARSPFTRTWALYQRVAAPEETLAPRAATLEEAPMVVVSDVPAEHELSQRTAEPVGFSRDDLASAGPAALQRVGTPEEPRVGLVATTHRVRLDGDAWARVLEACPDLLKQEFTSDVCDATSLPPTSMRRLVLAAGSLVADFELAHGGLARTELDEQIARSPFTRTWALYQRVAAPEETLAPRAAPPATLQDSESFASLDVEEPPAVLRREGTPEVATMVAHEARAPALQRVGTPEEPRVGLVATTHRVRLDGDAWARVLEACPDLLKQEFTSDVCDATSLPPTSMRRLVLAAGSLVVDFELAHGGLAGTELDEQIARSPFTRTWALYQRVAAPEETLAPRAAPPAALQDSESFASLDVEEPPAVLRREGTPEVATMVAHEARAPALQRVGTPEEPRVGLVATTHRVRLDGDAWARVLEACPDLLKREFTSDVCDATSLPPTSMRRLVLAAGSLVVDFELAHGGLARTELDEQIARSPFTRTWALYQRVAAPEETLAPRAAPLEEAPMVVVSDVPAEHELSQRTAEPVGFSRDDLASAGPAALQRVGTPEEPRVGLVATTHRVRLDGDAWARVLEACPDLLKQEFTSDVCDATSLPPTSMRRLVLAAGSLVADFELAHGGLARTELDEQIARSPFIRTWALYQRVAAPEETLGPRAAPPATLQDSESFASLDVEEPPAVLRREGTPEVATMVAHEARAPALQRVGTPEEPRVGLVATTHRVRLDGDAWARVLEACPDLLKQEFTSDVCDATSLPPTSMRRLVLAAGSLVADFELAHGGLARTELNEQIARSPFTRTWALYQRVAAPEETLGPRAAPPAALQDSESFASLDVEEPPAVLRREGTPEVATMVAHEARAPALQRVGTPEEPRVGLVATTHRVRLDGDAWARVLEACPDLLKREFTSDVCDATSLPPTSMRRLVLAAGSLVADFELAHGGLARTELDEQIARSPFTRTWALYQRVAAPEETLGPRTAPPAALQDSESFASLDVEEPPAVLRREGTPEVATMVAHEARAPALQRVGTPEEPRVGLVATKHRVRLDGDAWARVLEACPDLLKQEFTSDVCDATSLPPTSMRRLVLAAGSLVADFELAHGGLARTELDEQIARSPFTRTWALYQRVAAPEETLGPRTAPPAALQDSESFASLDVEEPPAVLRREGTPEVATMVAHEARAPALQRVGTPEEPRVGLVATKHRVRLDGDAWARVLEACPDLLKQEFTSDVCDATSLPPTSMRRLVLAAGSLVADFELAHGGLARTELNEQIARSPFTRTWALYQRVAAPEETLGPRAAPPAALQDSESFASLDVEEPPAVLRREGTPEVATMVAHEARAPALQRVGTPEEPRVGLVATTHRVRLDGDAWARVLEACPDLLKREFTSDVCDATSLPPTSMRRLVLAAGSLVADFELAHGGLARTELNEQIARSPFTRTWALYQRVAAPEETLGPRAAPPAALQDSESFASLDVEEPPAVLRREGTPEVATMVAHEARAPALQRVGTPEEPRVGLVATKHRVRLDGDAWARVLEACPDLLKQEFTSDVCDATSLPPTSMRRLVLAAGSLVADFELAHGGLARTELNEQIARSPFTRTWALYQRVAAPEETLAPRAAPLEEAPMVVVSDVPAEHELSQRTAEPVGFSRDDLASAGPAALQRVGTPEEPRVGLVATTHRVRLDGDAWARVLEACPDLLKQEFTSDVCDATSLPPTSMRRLVLAAGSLVADFELAHGGLARTELDEQIARSPFTRTWALYQRVAAPEETLAPRAAPPATLQDSESFASLDVEEPPAVLRREGTPEVATMVAHEARAPALQRVGTPEEPRVGLVATTHRVRLDGDAWARVLEACPDLLKQEFTSDVCDATSLPPTSMRRLVLAAGSLVADFELAHGGLARTELDEQIARSPFTRTWALYQRVAAPEETLGPRAAPPAALQDSESFASLDVEEPPAVLRREGTPEVATMVAHEARAPALQRVGTPEEPRVGLVATTHRVRLDGDAWARVLEACPDLLKREFTSDVCDATSLPPTSMRRLVLAAGSLVADFELAHGGLARTELDEQIARSPFTRTWALYQRVAAPEETLAPRAAPLEEAPMVVVSDVPAEHELSQRTAEPVGFSRDDLASAGPAALQRVGTPEEPRVGLVATTHRVRLDGDAWARVLEACPDLLKQEFTSDVCDATSLPPTSMRRLVLAAGSLVADFELAHGGLARTELDEQIARSPYTRTWALYQRVAAPEETLAPRAATLEEAPMVVVSDVPAEHELSQRTAEPVGFSRDDLASAGPAALQRVGTPEEPRVGLVATTHRVRLDGDAWARVLEACPDLLKQEFTSDVCDATSLPPTSMRRLVLAAGSLVADFELAHGGLARTELDEQIARSPFTRTWALYQRVAAPEETLGPRAAPPAALQDSESFASLDVEEPPAVLRREGTPEVATMVAHEARAPALQRVGTPEEPRVGLVATTHRVRLDGDAWARVLEACPDLLKREFTSDVCDATSLPPTSMRRLVLAAGSLVVDFELAHGGLARTELDEQIARSPFTRTWALYQRVAAPEETLGPRAAPLEEAPMVVVSDVPAEHELSQRTAEPVGFSRDDLASAGPAALQRVGTPEEPRVGLCHTHRVLWTR